MNELAEKSSEEQAQILNDFAPAFFNRWETTENAGAALYQVAAGLNKSARYLVQELSYQVEMVELEMVERQRRASDALSSPGV